VSNYWLGALRGLASGAFIWTLDPGIHPWRALAAALLLTAVVVITDERARRIER
jgi:hypothetical protein